MVPIHICKTLSSCHLCTAPSLPPVPRWVAMEAGHTDGVVDLEGPGGWASRPEQYSCTLYGQRGWTSRAENLTDVLGSNMFSTLVTIPKNTAFCPHFTIYLIFILLILYPFLYGSGRFLKSPLDTVLISTSITLWVWIVRLSSHARVTPWNLGWRAVIVWSSLRELYLSSSFCFIFFWIIQSIFWSSGFNHGWTKTANVGKSIFLSTQGKKVGYTAF